ncbi:hypothetical protein N0V88_005354 [Collariella sp. IMI 366227]|nr:hypothetical protein N0V88_005354 [Collariella sp. IMI 366227]
MVGFARLVTDHVTFGYLTDVYVLAEHQGKGCLLFTRDRSAAKLYRETIGAKETSETTSSRLICMERPGTISKALGEGR